MLTFLGYIFDFLNKVLDFEILNGISIYSMLFYNMFIISFWIVITRRS